MTKIARAEVELRPITSVHVWDGTEHVVGLDVIYDPKDGTYCVVCLDEVAKALSSLSLSELGSTTSLSRHVSEVVLKDKGRYCVRSGKAYVPLKTASRVRLLQHVLVPGSSVKGLLRTSVMYKLLKDMSLSDPSMFKRVVSSGINLYGDPKNAAQGLEGQLFRRPRLPRQGGFVDSFQSLLVSDPKEIDGLVGVTSIQVYELTTSKGLAGPITSMLAEVLVDGVLRYDLCVVEPAIDEVVMEETILVRGQPADRGTIKEIIGTLKKLSADLISDSLRVFSEDLIDHEISRVERVTDLEEYLELLRKLRNSVGKDGCFPLRIGFGVGHMGKTIDLLLLRYFRDLYSQIASVMSSRYRRMWDERTIKLAVIDDVKVGMGWGWVCLRRI